MPRLFRGLLVALGGVGLAAALAACSVQPQRTVAGSVEPLDGPPQEPHPDLALLPDPAPREEPYCKPCLRPYTIAGRRYHPLSTTSGYLKRGTASWYGRKFHGQPTATGETFDMYALSAAHTTLPIPSYVEVTNLANGKRVVVRVNDRGPFKDNRLIDLSYAAAVRLGMVEAGKVAVEVKAVDAGTEPSRFAETEPVWLQVGAFSEHDNAARLHETLAASGFSAVSVRSAQVGGKQWHRVTIGPLTQEAASLAASRLLALGLAAPRLWVP